MDDSLQQNTALLENKPDESKKKKKEEQIKERRRRILAKEAVEVDNKVKVISLLDDGLSVNAALDIVVTSGKDDFIDLLINRGADVNEGLYFAVKANNKDAITHLLVEGANINTNTRNGKTPLHTAVMQKLVDFELVEHLIKNGADINIKTNDNKTALQLFQTCLEGKNNNDPKTEKTRECIKILLSSYSVGNTGEIVSCTGDLELESEAWQEYPPDGTTTSDESRVSNRIMKPSAGRIGEQLERDMLSSRRRHAVDGDDDNIFKCIKGLPGGMSGYSYQIKFFTLYALINTKLANSYESQYTYKLSTEVMDLVPFDDVCLIKTRPERITCELVQLKQTKIPEMRKIKESKFFILLRSENNVKEYIKGNDSIVKMFIKFNSIKDNLRYRDTCGEFIHCENTNFENDTSPCLIRADTVNDDLLCGVKCEKWSIDSYYLIIEIKYVLLNLIQTAPYFNMINENFKIEIKKQIEILDIWKRTKTLDKNLNHKTLGCMQNIASKSLKAIEKYIKYLENCKKEIESAKDLEIIKKNLPNECHVPNTVHLNIFKKLSLIKIKELSNSFVSDRDIFSHFFGHDEIGMIKKIENFVKHFNIYTNCPTSDKLDEIMTEEIRKEFQIHSPAFITAFCLNYFTKWISNFERGEGKSFTDREGNRLFHHIRMMIFNESNKSYIKQLESNIRFPNQNEQVIHFLKNENKTKILKVISRYTRLHTIYIFQTVQNIKKKSKHIKYINSILCTTSEHILKSDENLRNLFAIFKSKDTNDLLILECSDDIQLIQNFSKVFHNLQNIEAMTEIKKIIIISQNDNILGATDIATIGNMPFYRTITFMDLTKESQEYVLNKNVNFINNPNSINKSFKIRDFITKNAWKVIDEDILSFIVTNSEDIVLGNETPFISDEYNAEYFIPRYLLNIDVNVFKNCGYVLFFVTGITKDQLNSKVSLEESSIYIWAQNELYDKGIVLMPQSHNSTTVTIKTSTEIFKQLSNNCPCCCWLDYKGGLFYIKDSNKKNADVMEKTLLSYRSVPENLEDKIIIIANDAGEGKSTALTHVAHCMRKKSENSWIFRVNLRNYSDKDLPISLNNITFSVDDTKSAIEFFTCMVVNASNKLELKLLQAVLNEDCEMEAILLFDGYDEVSPGYKEQTCKLLKALTKSNVRQIWVTTRVHLTDYLEEQLQVPVFTFAPFTEREEIKFISNYWRRYLKSYEYTQENIREKKRILNFFNKTELMTGVDEVDLNRILLELYKYVDKEIKVYAAAFLRLWKKSTIHFGYLNSALHLEMLAKNIMQREWNLSTCHYWNFFELYTDFVNNKLEIYHNRGTMRASNEYIKDQADMASVSIRKMHNEIAVRTLFKHSILPVLPDLYICNEHPGFSEKLTRVGLVKCYGSRVEYVHRTFAEYFFSDYLVTHLIYPVVQKEFIFEILHGIHYYLVRYFFDKFLLQRRRLLMSDDKERDMLEHVDPFSNIIEQSVLKDIMNHHYNNNENILHTLAREGHVQIFLLIFHNIKNSDFIELVNLFHICYSPPILHLALFEKRIEMFNTIIDCVRKLPKIFICTVLPLEIQLIKQSADVDVTTLNIAIEMELTEAVIIIIENFKDQVNELKAYLYSTYSTSLHNAALYGNVKICELIIKTAQEHAFFSDLIMKCDINGGTALHISVRESNVNMCEFILKETEHYPNVFKRLILHCDENKDTFLHLASYKITVNFSEPIINYVHKHKDVFKELITMCNSEYDTVLHIAAKFNNSYMCSLVLKNTEQYRDVFKTLTAIRNINGDTALHIATSYGRNHLICLILQSAVKYDDVFKHLITQCDRNKRTVLHVAATYGHYVACGIILEYANIYPNILEILVMQCDENGMTALEIAEQKGHKNVCKVFLETILRSRYALRVWLSKIKVRAKVISTPAGIKKYKYKNVINNRSELLALYRSVARSKVYDLLIIRNLRIFHYANQLFYRKYF